MGVQSVCLHHVNHNPKSKRDNRSAPGMRLTEDCSWMTDRGSSTSKLPTGDSRWMGCSAIPSDGVCLDLGPIRGAFFADGTDIIIMASSIHHMWPTNSLWGLGCKADCSSVWISALRTPSYSSCATLLQLSLTHLSQECMWSLDLSKSLDIFTSKSLQYASWHHTTMVMWCQEAYWRDMVVWCQEAYWRDLLVKMSRDLLKSRAAHNQHQIVESSMVFNHWLYLWWTRQTYMTTRMNMVNTPAITKHNK